MTTKLITTFLSCAMIIASGQTAKASTVINGDCFFTAMKNGAIQEQKELHLTPIDPWNHFGLALSGNQAPFQIQVMLLVANYDQIGATPSDRIRMTISQGSVTSHHSISGSALAGGEKLNGTLQVTGKSINCIIQQILPPPADSTLKEEN